MPDLEALGDSATGAALARAVEPRAGAADDGHTHQANCLNCGEPLAGAYCHRCGQRGHVHRTIGAWWHDFLHSVLHVDGKFWATIRLLAWRPGDLTRRYIHGERARFISPMALFLFTVFLMFAVFSLLGATEVGVPPETRAEMSREVSTNLAEVRERIAADRRLREEALAAGRSTEAADASLAINLETERKLEQASRELAAGRAPLVTDLRTGWPLLDTAIDKGRQNPSLLFYKLKANAYKFSWALIPISVPFVWMLFLHRRRYRQEFTGYDHLVFVTYSIAFMSIALVAMVVIDAIGIESGLVDIAFLAIPPLHMYRQLRGAYGLSRFSAAWRALALTIFAGLALTLFLLLLLAIGAFG